MENDSNRPHENRLLGVVRFYDEDRGFGFIDTNGYGIDSLGQENYSESVELFFCERDFRGFVCANEWVTFVYKKANGKKRDYAKYIRPMRNTIEDLQLALNYHGPYGKMSVGESRADINVLASVLSRSLIKKGNTFQLTYDVLIEAYKRQFLSHVILLQYPKLSGLFISPEVFSIEVRDLSSHNALLYDYSLQLLDEIVFKNTVKEWGQFDKCVLHLSEKGLESLRERINLYRLKNQWQVLYFWRNVPIDSFKRLIIGVQPLSPELRIIAYEKTLDVSFLRHDSMIEFWNKSACNLPMDSHSYTTSRDNHNDIRIPSGVVDYIVNSALSNDYLLLVVFIQSANPICYQAIKDKSIICTWLPKLGDDYVYHFLCHYKNIPDNVLSGFYDAVGVPRLVSAAAFSLLWEMYERIPSVIKVSIVAILHFEKEDEFTERSDWYGGYWTWGEGMKHQKYDINTYKRKYYSITVSVNSPLDTMSMNSLRKSKDTIEKFVKECVDKHQSNTLFSCPVMGRYSIVFLSINDLPSDNSAVLFYGNLQVNELINSEVVIDD